MLPQVIGLLAERQFSVMPRQELGIGGIVGFLLFVGIVVGCCLFLHYARRCAEALEKLAKLMDRRVDVQTEDLERMKALEARLDYLKARSHVPPPPPQVPRDDGPLHRDIMTESEALIAAEQRGLR